MATPTAAAARPARRRWLPALRWIVGVSLLLLVAWRVDWREFRAVTSDAHVGLLVAVVLSSTVDRLWMASKWHYLIRHFGVAIRFVETLLIYYSGLLVGIVTQWQLGGDIARTVRLAHQTREHAKVLVSVVYEKLAGFAASGLMAIAAAILLHSRHPLAPTGLVVVGAGFAITALAAVPVCAAFGPVVRWLASLGSSRMANLGQEIERVVNRGDTLRRAMLVFFLLTLAEQSMPLVTIYLTQRALGFDLAPVELLAVVPIIIFFSRLPLSVDGIGVYEGLMVLLFGLMGMSATQAFALAITSRVAGLVSVTLGTGVCLAIHRYATRA